MSELAGRNRPAYLIYLSDALEYPPRAGYQVHLLWLARASSTRIPTRIFCWDRAAENNGVPLVPQGSDADFVHSMPRRGAGRLTRKRRYLGEAIAWTCAHAGPGSVLWVRSYSTALLLLPYLRSLSRSVPGLSTVYDAASFHRLEADLDRSRLLGHVRGFLEERLWTRFDRVRTLSGPMRDYLVSRGVPEKKIFVVPVGSEERTARWRPSARPKRLLYVGSDAPWQGLPELIEAMRLLAETDPEVRLSVVGPEPRGSDSAAVPANIHFQGPVSHASIERVYLEHDLFVLPRPRTSLTELVVPMKLPEAMSFGMPILATDLGALRWMTGEKGALLVSDNRPELLAEAIRSAFADPARLTATGDAALGRSREFTWERVGDQIVGALFPDKGRAGVARART